MKRFTTVLLFVLSLMGWEVLSSPTLWAAGVVGSGSPGSCSGNDVQTALNGGGTVTFNCGNDPLTIKANTYVISEDTTVFGENKITLNGENLRQIFIVESDATLTLHGIILLDGEFSAGGCAAVNINATLIARNVTFQGCRNTSATLGGGAVYNLGVFSAMDTTFLSNEATADGGAVLNRGIFSTSFVTFEANKTSDDGGAIFNDSDGVVTVNDTIFLGNTAADNGGAIDNTLSFPETEGSFTVLRSLFVDNSAVMLGGAINNVVGLLSVTNSTFTRNKANDGGAIFSDSTASLIVTFSTFFANRADTGSGIYRPLTGSVTLGYSILAGGRNEANTANELECDGPAYISLGFNLIEDGSCVSGSNSNDRLNTPPLLGALQENGGYSQSILPDATSPALAKVPAGQCAQRDQRGATRVAPCDIGAAERGGLFISAYMPRVRK